MFQTSLQYRYYVTAETGELVRGSRDREKQTRYNTELVYIQDREKVQDERDLSLGINCPNCGAPIRAWRKGVRLLRDTGCGIEFICVDIPSGYRSLSRSFWNEYL